MMLWRANGSSEIPKRIGKTPGRIVQSRALQECIEEYRGRTLDMYENECIIRSIKHIDTDLLSGVT